MKSAVVVTYHSPEDDGDGRSPDLFAREADAIQFVLDQQNEEDDVVVERWSERSHDNVTYYSVIEQGNDYGSYWKIESLPVR